MSDRLARLARLERVLSQALRMVRADATRAADRLDDLRRLRGDIEAAIDRQQSLAGIVVSPALNRLAAIGLRVAAAELELKALQDAVREQAVRLELVDKRLQAGRAEERMRMARKDLEELTARSVGASLPQDAAGRMGR